MTTNSYEIANKVARNNSRTTDKMWIVVECDTDGDRMTFDAIQCDYFPSGMRAAYKQGRKIA